MENKAENKPENKYVAPKPDGLFGARHIQYGLMFASTVLGYGMRTILNVAIVAMLEEEEHENFPTYPEWKSSKNIILSSFFWGYLSLQIGAGQLAKKYGPKMFLFSAILIASIFTILIPAFGKWFGYGGVIASRVIQGMCQGFLLPSIHHLLSSWTHISERARWGGVIYAGQAMGNVVAMPITGLICASSLGWPVVFYLYGGLGMLWCTCWFLFGYDSPYKHKTISSEEEAWLETGAESHEMGKNISTPWKDIFTSLPFIAVIISHCGQNWGFWTLLTEIPSYMNNIMNYDIDNNSLVSALPYLVMWLLTILMGSIADMLIDKQITSLIVSRKIFNSIGFFIPSIALLILGLVSKEQDIVVILILTIGVGFNAGQYSGFNVNHIDLSPEHAGTLMAITNTTATIFSILAPLAVDFVSSITGYSEHEVDLWNMVFFIAAAVYAFAGVVFIIFASGDVQKWNDTQVDDPLQHAVHKKILRKLSRTISA